MGSRTRKPEIGHVTCPWALKSVWSFFLIAPVRVGQGCSVTVAPFCKPLAALSWYVLR
jgi:hypothetical protein